MPKVSIVLTSYNHERYIAEAIESVLQQDFTDWELLIFDDGSQDQSQAMIRSFKDRRIRLFLHAANRGPNICLRETLAAATGEYVAIHHSDDVWERDKLSRQVAFLDAHLEIAACFTQVRFIDEQSASYEPPEGNFYRQRFLQPNRDRDAWLHFFFFEGNCLCHPSVLIRRAMYDRYGLAENVGLFQIPDFLMWVKLCRQEDIYIYPAPLVRFRLRRAQQTNTSGDRGDVGIRSQFEMYYVLQEYEKVTEPAQFLRIFPEAQAYVRDGRINLRYALAQLLLSVGYRSSCFAGLQLLHSLLAEQPEELARLYGYTELLFRRDTVTYDPFGIKSQQHYLQTSLYVDWGQGFLEPSRLQQEVYVQQDGTFLARFSVETAGEVHGLRFDPTENEMVAVHLNRVQVNGQDYAADKGTYVMQQEGFDYFITPDPHYCIPYHGQAPLQVIIHGKLLLSYDGLRFAERLRVEERAAMQAMQAAHAGLQENYNALQAAYDALFEKLTAIETSRGYGCVLWLRKWRSRLRQVVLVLCGKRSR